MRAGNARWDQGVDAGIMMKGHTVQHHDVAGIEGRQLALLRIGQERFRVVGPFHHHRGGPTGRPNGGDQRAGLPCTERSVIHDSLPVLAPTLQWQHAGRDRRLVDKDQSFTPL